VQAKIEKTAISVYDPDNVLEKAIQSVYNQYYNKWLTAYECQAFARAIYALKPRWVHQEKYLDLRLAYLFNETMVGNKDIVIFPSRPIFLREILENREINSYIYDPIVFVTQPIFHWLFKDYSVGIYLDYSKIKAANSGIKMMDIGGLTLIDKDDIAITEESIVKVVSKDMNVKTIVDDFSSSLQKVAHTEISRDMFKIDEDERDIFPGDQAWNKESKEFGFVFQVDPGEKGNIYMKIKDGAEQLVPKEEFDSKFVLV